MGFRAKSRFQMQGAQEGVAFDRPPNACMISVLAAKPALREVPKEEARRDTTRLQLLLVLVFLIY